MTDSVQKEKPMNILAIEDDEGDAVVLEKNLAQIPGLDFHVMRAKDAEGAVAMLTGGEVDLTILDYRLGSTCGLDVLERIRSVKTPAPVLVLSGCADAYAASQLAHAGADEYLTKSDLSPQRLQSAMQAARNRFQEHRTEQELQSGRDRVAVQLAEHNAELALRSRSDGLTGLLNRAAWIESVAAEHERAIRYGRVYTVLMIDVDRFKDYNDSLGHPAGDECLQKVAQTLLNSCRAPDLVGRYGGEEFVVLAPESSIESVRALAERIRKNVVDLRIPHPTSPVADMVTVSIGIAGSPADTWEEVVKHADEALYVAKALGRNLVWSSMPTPGEPQPMAEDRTLAILAIEDDRGDAEILRRQLSKVYGPQFTFIHSTTAAAGCAELAKGGIDVAFLDYRLGAESAGETIQSIRASGYLGPVIVVTGQGDEYTVAALMRAGADDYIAKSDLSPGVLQRAVQTAENQQRRRQAEARIRELLAELHSAKKSLEAKNARLAELYQTAHQFVDNVSHEFRTPLTVIREFTAIVRDGLAGEVQAQQREYLETVLNRADDLNRMVDDMLDISRLEAGMLGVCRRQGAVAEIVESVRTTLDRKAAASKATLQWDISSSLPAVYCDAEKISRVIINLTVNALKFSREGGHVRVSADWRPEDSFVRLAVKDNGPGISAEGLQVIFDRFKQVEAAAQGNIKGFGLGLCIARELVHLNLGEIGVESEIGKGSTFFLTIPIAEPTAIVEAYLRRFSPPAVSMVAAEAPHEAGPEVLDTADEFLSRQLRAGDLLLRPQPNRWLILWGGSPMELGERLAALQNARDEVNRYRPAVSIPAIGCTVRGSWRLAEQHRDFTTAFEAEYSASLMQNHGGINT